MRYDLPEYCLADLLYSDRDHRSFNNSSLFCYAEDGEKRGRLYLQKFFKAFKENFRQSTILWLLFAVLSVVWWIDFNFAGAVGGQIGFLLRVVFVVFGFILISALIYALPLTARYVNPISATLKNALILSLAKLPYTLVMVVITAGAVVASVWTTTTLMFALPMWFFFGGSLIAWLNSCILRRIFVIFEENDENDNTKEEG